MTELIVQPNAKSHQDVTTLARMSAAFRALENRKPNPILQDPLAELFVEGQTEQLLSWFPNSDAASTGSALRTLIIDKLLLRECSEYKVGTVLSVGAGFDTRPYRLPLSPELNWIEIDFPDVISHKSKILANRRSACSVTRIASDLLEPSLHRSILPSLASTDGYTLVITEGLLVYLSELDVQQLSAGLQGANAWITDIASPLVRDTLNEWTMSGGNPKNLRWSFAPDDPNGYFSRLGWKVESNHSLIAKAQQLSRPLLDSKVETALTQMGLDAKKLATVSLLRAA
jgi:methyltransferase (TIGR00027 family)